IIAVGSVTTLNGEFFTTNGLIVQYDPNDSATPGTLSVSDGAGDVHLRSVAIDSQGRVVVAGRDAQDFVVGRFKAAPLIGGAGILGGPQDSMGGMDSTSSGGSENASALTGLIADGAFNGGLLKTLDFTDLADSFPNDDDALYV